MKTSIELIKEELALDVLKAHRDLHFQRINNITSNNIIEKVMDKAKTYAIGPNEILSNVMNNESVYAKVLETKYKVQYSLDKPQDPNHII